MLPLPLRWCVLAGTTAAVAHLAVAHIMTPAPAATVAAAALYAAVNCAGLYTRFLTDRGQRRAFLETHRSIMTRYRTQRENDRQEKLLLSGTRKCACYPVWYAMRRGAMLVAMQLPTWNSRFVCGPVRLSLVNKKLALDTSVGIGSIRVKFAD